ncbi:T9SS type B sorting domain-containing protein [Phaeocystidibacter luteus]|uniref:T9SS type B sorting domain-containing protein n=1 Tax=Phaeocystidibacter luteus TaxID=911197 RepID=A0A6N6RI26_9FLAO|nr:gliding motility-associated C-terminal domain-containing protein [Phaeocystidibacter luteus]KAB2809937.1 T9SS type B sorting domain-containing protein [Phaeocystidibacter luteus]
MRSTLIASLFTLFTLTVTGQTQNFVVNGGFEPTDCPSTGTTLFEIAPPWRDPFTSSDHYGPCTFPGSATTNNNVPPQEGDGNVGLYGYGRFGQIYNREYIIGELTTALTAGQRYRVSYWVHPVYTPQFDINAGIDGPDVLFFESYSDFTSSVQRNNYDYSSDSALHPDYTITELNEWTQVCLNFTARGYERYIALGTFRTDEEVQAELLGGNTQPTLGYYLIDNVVVQPIDEPVLTGTRELCPGGEITLTVPDGLFGEWDDGSTALTRVIDEPGTYSYGYQDGICYRVDQVVVEEVNCTPCNVYYPSAFTPNGDGTNEVWMPVFECAPIEYQLEIYDRIGNLVFQTYDRNNSWSPPADAQEGTYVAILRFTYELYGDRTVIQERVEVSLMR